MNSPDKVPPTRRTKQFPIGDIGAREFQAAKSFLADLDPRDGDEIGYDDIDGAADKVAWRLNAAIFLNNQVVTSAQETDKAAKDLCKVWDQGVVIKHTYNKCALIGYQLAELMSQESRFLPPISRDFSTELTRMAYMPESDPLPFGESAWGCMKRHRRVFSVMSELCDIGSEIYEIDTPDRDALFRAGMALPYMLASANRLEGYGRDVIGVAADRISASSLCKKLVRTYNK